jgi:cytochrome P450
MVDQPMTGHTSTTYETVDFFPLDPRIHDDFWNENTAVREKCPVGWATSYWSMTEPPGQWIINTYADAMNAASDWETYSSAGGVSSVQFPLESLRLIPVETDPPMHREIRKALNPYFTPTALAANDDEIAGVVDKLIEECLAQGGPVDFVESFTSQLVPTVYLGPGFLNQGAEHGARLLDLVRILLTQPELTLETAPKLLAWCAELLELRRSEGERTDLAGMIAHLGLEDGGNGGRFRLSERERVETLNLAVMAGMETTMGGLGAVAWQLAERADFRERLRDADERTLDRAIEEFLRFSTPVPTEGRTLTRETTVGGCPMKPGDRVLLNFAAANLDPEQFPDPHTIDFDRPNVSSHLAFGAGIHRCLGAHLARREIKASIKAICALSEFRFDPAQQIQFRASFARGPKTIPVFMAR